MIKTYKATIRPTVSGGNIEVKISANTPYQARELIKTLPYFSSFVKMPILENEEENHLSKVSELVKKANDKEQAKLAGID